MQYKIILFFSLAMVVCSAKPMYSQEVKSSLDQFIEKKRNYNKISENGYAILLYNGNEKQALRVYNSIQKDYKNIEVKLSYVSPNWKVITKAYSTKIEAERIYLILKNKHPNAKIL